MSKAHQETGTSSHKSSKRKLDGENVLPSKKSKKLHGSSSQRAKAQEKSSRPTDPIAPRSVDIDENVAKRDPALLADFFAQKIAKHYKDSPSIEREDMAVPQSWLRDTTEFDPAHSASNLPSYLDKFVQGGKASLSTCKTEASPHTIIIASSGIRVADLVRELRVYHSERSKVAKLIAKHQKLKENAEFLAKTRVGIAVCTPARLLALLEQDAIKVKDLRTIVVDASYLDEKKRSIVDMLEVFEPLMRLLHSEKVKARLEDGKGASLLVF